MKAANFLAENLDLVGAAFYRVEDQGKFLRAYVFSQIPKLTFLNKLIKVPFHSLGNPVENPIDLIGRAVKENKIILDSNIYKFITPVLSKTTASIIKSTTGMNLIIIIPANYNQKPVGALLTATKKKFFTPYQINCLKIFADQLGLAIGNVQAHEECITGFVKKENLLERIDQILAGNLDFKVLAKKAVDFFSEEMGFVGAAIARKESPKTAKAYVYSFTSYTKTIEKLFPVRFDLIKISLENPESLAAKTIINNQIYCATDLNETVKGAVPKVMLKAIQKACRVKKVCMFPIRCFGQAEGVLFIGAFKNDFTEEQIEITKKFTERLGFALQNVLAHEKIIKKYEENQPKNLEIINETNKLFAGKLNSKELAEEAASLFSRKMNLVGVGIFEKDNHFLRAVAFSKNTTTKFIDKILPLPIHKLITPVDNPVNLLGKTVKNAKSYTQNNIKDFATGIIPNKLLESVQKGIHAKCFVSMPIMNNNEVLGAIICSTKKLIFEASDLETIKTFSNQLGFAMRNTVAHETKLKEQEEKIKLSVNDQTDKKFENYIRIIREIDQSILGAKDSKKASEMITKQLVKTLGITYAVILKWDEQVKTLKLESIEAPKKAMEIVVKYIGKPLEAIYFSPEIKSHLSNHYLKCLLQRKTFKSRDLYDSATPYIGKKTTMFLQKILKMKMSLTIPLYYGQNNLGVLGIIWNKDKISGLEEETLKTFADQLSITLNNLTAHEQVVKKYEEKIQQAKGRDEKNYQKHLEIIKEINQLLSGKLNFKEIAENAITEFSHKMGFVGANIYRKQGAYVQSYIYSKNKFTKFMAKLIPDEVYTATKTPIENPVNLIGKAAKYGEIYSSPSLKDVGSGMVSDKIIGLLSKGLPVKCYLVLPIKCNNQVEGVFCVATKKEKFDDHEIFAVKIFTEQLGLAMANAYTHKKFVEKYELVHTDQKQLIGHMELIKKTNEILAGTLNKEELMRSAVNNFVKELNLIGTGIFLIDRKKNVVSSKYFSTKPIKVAEKFLNKNLSNIEVSLDDESNLLTKTCKEGQIHASRNLFDFGKGFFTEKQAKILEKIIRLRLVSTFPIFYKKEIIGVLMNGHQDIEKLTPQLTTLIQTLANQIGITLGNVAAHEQVVEEYEKKLSEKENGKQQENKSLQNYLKIISSTNNLLTGELDFQKVAQKSVTAFTEEAGFAGGAVFRREKNKLRAYVFTENKHTRQVIKLMLPKKFSDITTPIENPENLIGKTALTGEIFTGPRMREFTRGFVKNEKLMDVFQKVARAEFIISAPIFSAGKVEGVLFVGTREKSFTEDQTALIKIFAEQLGLAMGNIIAHERIIKKYQEEQEMRKRQIDPNKKPNIKFTLRISKEIERYLAWKVNNTNNTKADFLRDAILKEIMENDENYQDFKKI